MFNIARRISKRLSKIVHIYMIFICLNHGTTQLQDHIIAQQLKKLLIAKEFLGLKHREKIVNFLVKAKQIFVQHKAHKIFIILRIALQILLIL